MKRHYPKDVKECLMNASDMPAPEAVKGMDKYIAGDIGHAAAIDGQVSGKVRFLIEKTVGW
jgi:hypothetical protein